MNERATGPGAHPSCGRQGARLTGTAEQSEESGELPRAQPPFGGRSRQRPLSHGGRPHFGCCAVFFRGFRALSWVSCSKRSRRRDVASQISTPTASAAWKERPLLCAPDDETQEPKDHDKSARPTKSGSSPGTTRAIETRVLPGFPRIAWHARSSGAPAATTRAATPRRQTNAGPTTATVGRKTVRALGPPSLNSDLERCRVQFPHDEECIILDGRIHGAPFAQLELKRGCARIEAPAHDKP